MSAACVQMGMLCAQGSPALLLTAPPLKKYQRNAAPNAEVVYMSAFDTNTNQSGSYQAAPVISADVWRDKFCVRMRGVTPHVEILPSPQRDRAALAVMVAI